MLLQKINIYLLRFSLNCNLFTTFFHLFFFCVWYGVFMPWSTWATERTSCRSCSSYIPWNLHIKLRSPGLTSFTSATILLTLTRKLLLTAYFTRKLILSHMKSFTGFVVVYHHFLTVAFLIDAITALWDRSYRKKIAFFPIDSWYSSSTWRALIISQTIDSPLFNY